MYKHRQVSSPTHAPPTNHAPCIFTAMDSARFDDVRRALQYSPSSLHLKRPIRYSPPLYPVDYGLHLAEKWDALLSHCTRTGMMDASFAEGSLTLRQHLASMHAILLYLIQHRGPFEPERLPLHRAIRCGMPRVAAMLLEMDKQGDLVQRVDSTGKTALHVMAALIGANQCTAFGGMSDRRLIRIFGRHGMDMNAQDAEGATALHEVVKAAERGFWGYGIRRTTRGGGRWSRAEGVVEEMIMWGADPYRRDSNGRSVLEEMVRRGGYMLMVRCMARVYDWVRGGEWKWKGSEAKLGLWKDVPDEVVEKIVELLGPVRAVRGLGMTCTRLRKVVCGGVVFGEMRMERVMDRARAVMQEEWTRREEDSNVGGVESE